MHRRHLLLLAAALLPCLAPGAGAQLQDQTPAGPRYYVVNVQPANFTLTVNDIRWGGVPRASEPRAVERSGAVLQSRLGGAPAGKPASNSVELIWQTQSTDSAIAGWARAGTARPPSDVTITAMSAAGQPVARYLLHRAVPAKLWLDQMNAGASKIAQTHLTLDAQSVTVLPTGT